VTSGDRTVTLLAAGGTISCTLDAAGAAVPTLSAADLASSFPKVSGVRVDAVDTARFSSWNVTVPELLELSRRVGAALQDSDGVVVTQGTDTLEETAYLLHLTVDSSRPVVVTGAMRNASLPGHDGPRNLQAAVITAASPSAAGRGCLVVFNDEIHLAGRVSKRHSTSLSTFQSPETGPVGAVDGSAVTFFGPPVARRTYPVAALSGSARVPLVKVAVGLDAAFLEGVLATGVDGLVVEGTGVGHVPASWMPAIRSAVAGGVPVVLSTRTGAGPVRAEYGGPGGGHDLATAGVIHAGRRTGLMARIELICALGAGLRGDELRATFEG
jgi:L-asparaginase